MYTSFCRSKVPLDLVFIFGTVMASVTMKGGCHTPVPVDVSFKEDSLKRYNMSSYWYIKKTRGVGGVGVDLPTCKTETFLLMPLAFIKR